MVYSAVVSAVEKYQDAHLKGHKLIFGLDANTYSHVRLACNEVARAEQAFCHRPMRSPEAVALELIADY